ncbi:P-loop containing nucleoside triphosphate hydrolase protein [Patellaria atrata CBS 101060]|uniref:P-loop containing nucleoside triphosphate hydrolase protein n=1 Tax=Patellaria atrata CBS 101060 TaxID=1346257 RepID=A0A9P4SGC8_9PEZI|nr:P-loop containing nucleoside triphosphate hydrolase protein [Patellaria atrata CBS 101060]
MAFPRLPRGAPLTSTSASINTTDPTLSNLPIQILEAFIPGYGIISKFILDVSGFDIGIAVSLFLLSFASFKAYTYLWGQAYSSFQTYLTSSVYVDDGDELFDGVLEWIAAQQMSKDSRSIKAVSRHGSSNGMNDEVDHGDALDELGNFNFAKWLAKVPPRYEPYFGVHHFDHKGRRFMFDRRRKETANIPSPWQRNSEEQVIKLTCIGRSTKPIKDLLDYIRVWSLEKEASMTVIRRPAPKERVRYSGAWARVSSRPSRPMDTVVLDPEQKELVIKDINEYLHPSSPRWYSSRGIPYRRGYLFHGEPGTGKTSLSFALAGIFGLDIYVISLLEPTLTESDLNNLFSNLPRRCIVLLEDIDTAGLIRDEVSDEKPVPSKTKADETEKEQISAAITKAITTVSRKSKADEAKQGISLSGLLNAIDGVASHEGRVLVMTTNHPEKLDEALIRPGRVDMQVKFSLATKLQAKEIFVRMYVSDRTRISKAGTKTEPDAPVTNGVAGKAANTTKSSLTNGNLANGFASKADGVVNPVLNVKDGAAKKKIERLAERFAGCIPEGRFSPAEIQGFLLTRKKDPEKALAEVELWTEALLEAKEKKARVMRGLHVHC